MFFDPFGCFSLYVTNQVRNGSRPRQTAQDVNMIFDTTDLQSRTPEPLKRSGHIGMHLGSKRFVLKEWTPVLRRENDVKVNLCQRLWHVLRLLRLDSSEREGRVVTAGMKTSQIANIKRTGRHRECRWRDVVPFQGTRNTFEFAPGCATFGRDPGLCCMPLSGAVRGAKV